MTPRRHSTKFNPLEKIVVTDIPPKGQRRYGRHHAANAPRSQRNGTFEPQLIPKHQRRLPGFDDKILALYAKGMTTRDIQDIVQKLYGVDVSPTLVSEITADLDAEVTAWRTRRLDAVWPIVYLDGIVVHVRGENGRVSQHTMLKYVTDKDSREVAGDLKTSYQSATVLEAEHALEDFAKKWEEKYPTIVRHWRLKWADIIAMFNFPPPAIRKAIDTTNAIESVNGVIRKFTRNRKQYPYGESALKLVYLSIHEASKKWTMPIVGWKAALNHFAIVFEGRMPTRPES